MLSCRDIAPWLNTHSPTACGGKVVAPATKGGMHFQRPQGGCPVFAAKGGIYTGAPKGAHLASAAILYTSRGRSPQPVREASAGPGQNPWRPGPKARRRHQPSRRSRVNLREYWKAPPRSQSRSRPRRKAPEPTKKSCEKCASFPHSLFLFPYSFCSSASGAGASSSGVPSSSVSSAGSAVSAASPVSSGSSASTAGVSSFFSSTGG